MHGYNQGVHTVHELIDTTSPDFFLLQEHWLTPANLCKFTNDFKDYYFFGSSAMCDAVSAGPLYGRPFGGTAILIKANLLQYCECIAAFDRFVIIRCGDVLIVNVYFPAAGSINRDLIYSELTNEISVWMSKYSNCPCIIGGDFNTNLDINNCEVTRIMNDFVRTHHFVRCDVIFPNNCQFTYINESLNHRSKIDYFLCQNLTTRGFEILDCDVNFSDHLPLSLLCTVNVNYFINQTDKTNRDIIMQMRWDRGDIKMYEYLTGELLRPILSELNDISTKRYDNSDLRRLLNDIYSKIVDTLKFCSGQTIPRVKKIFYKFWWSQELDAFKAASKDKEALWRAAGRPLSGQIYTDRCKAKREYRQALRSSQRNEINYYSNDLHDALVKKRPTEFWKCWNSKFGSKAQVHIQIDGRVDAEYVASAFATHFSKTCSNLTEAGSSRLKDSYEMLRGNYVGSPFISEYLFDAELVESIICTMKKGKAAGLDALTVEHLLYAHPIIAGLLAKLFNLCLAVGCIPDAFCFSYTVPLLKCAAGSKNMTVDDFRGISISPVMSKLFEHCVLRKFDSFFITHKNQFGFKKETGCTHAIFTAKGIINHYIQRGSTVNLCTIDIAKAFDRMNHHGLFIKLMSKKIPSCILTVIEKWILHSFSCVKWNAVYSDFYALTCGIRQGGVLSPIFFAIFIDDVIDAVDNSKFGCYFGHLCASIILFADDMLLLAPSVSALQELISLCEEKLSVMDLSINSKKSFCIRVGPRFSAECANISLSSGSDIQWVSTVRYLGVFLASSRTFKCVLNNAKQSFYRSFNAIYGKIGGHATEDVILHLLYTKALPCLLYATEVLPLKRADIQSLEFTFNRILFKLFKTSSIEIVNECKTYFGIINMNELIDKRRVKFNNKVQNTHNLIYNFCEN